MENIEIKINEQDNNTTKFFIQENDKTVEILKISKDGFFYRGERIDDIHDIYNKP